MLILLFFLIAVAAAIQFDMKDSPLPRSPEALHLRSLLEGKDVDLPLSLGEYNRTDVFDAYSKYTKALKSEVDGYRRLRVDYSSVDYDTPVLMWLEYRQNDYTLAFIMGTIFGIGGLFAFFIVCMACAPASSFDK
jgi:hypothetical protein